MTSTEELVQLFNMNKEFLHEYDKARAESDIWERISKDIPPGTQSKHERESRLSALLKEPAAAIHRRATLYNCGPVAKPMWDRIIDKKLTVTSALGIMQHAKHLAVDHDINMESAVTQALEEYDSRPYVRFVDGIPIKMGAPRKKGSPPPPKKRKAIRGRPKEGRSAESILTEKIRRDISEYIESRIGKVDEALREQLLQETTIAVRILIHEFQTKLRRLVEMYDSAIKADLAVSRRDVMEACQTLHMDPPADGKPADMDKAAKQKRRLARLYHPDLHGGEEKDAMRAKFDAIMAAFDRLEKYNEKLKPTGKENGSDGKHSEGGGPRA